jgi:AGZA family xanthine/uracil permease-like MFS transporter
MSFLERRFGLSAAGTSARRELTAGLTTFATLAYILFLQPVLMASVGMPPGGVLFATCVSSAAACLVMAGWANYPIALAPGMGTNFFFVFTVCGAMGFSWQQALAANLIAGVLFLALIPTGFRERVMEAVPAPLGHAIGVGFGFLIAAVGLEWAGLLTREGARLGIGELGAPTTRLAVAGLALGAVLLARGVQTALLITLLATAGLGHLLQRTTGAALIGTPDVVWPSPVGTAFRLDLGGLFARPTGQWLSVIFVFFLLNLFDSIATLLGVGQRAGLLVDGRLPRARGAFAADAVGTVVGALLGTSSVTSYVESAAGVSAGGRTGLVAATVGVCMLLALVAAPLLAGLAAGVPVGDATHYPVVAPVLILIGVLMSGGLRRIEWSDPRQAVPALLTVTVMPLSRSITDGLAWGFMATSLLDLCARGERRVSPWVHGFAVVFLLRYLLR